MGLMYMYTAWSLEDGQLWRPWDYLCIDVK